MARALFYKSADPSSQLSLMKRFYEVCSTDLIDQADCCLWSLQASDEIWPPYQSLMNISDI